MGHFHSKMGAMVIFVLLIQFLGLCSLVRGNPNTNVTSVLCNSAVYYKDDPFATSLAYVLTELETVTPTRTGYDHRNISPSPNAFAYGHASCSHNLTSSDCSKCLAAAETTMLSTCNSSIGARSVLHDCTIRYEQYPFDD